MGSRLFSLLNILVLLVLPTVAAASPETAPNQLQLKDVSAKASAGLADRGIFSDLDARVHIAAPAVAPGLEAVAVLGGRLLLLYLDGLPVKAYPRTGPARGDQALPLRPRDRAELAPLLASTRLRFLAANAAIPGGDRDGDGIPDLLDALIGAHKAALNRARYGAGYMRIPFPGGDVPRDVGVCTDVVIRALRNAGIDLQEELFADIGRAPRSYPMVKRRNPNIDHRRVRTLLPYFRRHFAERTPAVDDERDPLRAGDVVFLDTMKWKTGPDHIGILSERRGPSGHLLVINNWTDGFVTSEMDLLGFVPVTDRFRLQGK